MDDQAGDDDDYSDDDLDALPDHAFHELQENAIQFTQQPSLNPQAQLPTVKQSPRLAGGFGRLSVGGPASHAPNQHVFQAPSSDYGDFDEEMLDGEIFDAAEEPALAARYDAYAGEKEPGEFTQREQWRLQNYGSNPRESRPPEARQLFNQHGAVSVPFPTGNDSGGPNATGRGGKAVYLVNQNPTGPPAQGSADVNALQAQVQKVGLLKTQLCWDCLLILLLSCYVNVRHFNRPFKMPTTTLTQRLAKLLSCEPMRRRSGRTLRVKRRLYKKCTLMKQRDKGLKWKRHGPSFRRSPRRKTSLKMILRKGPSKSETYRELLRKEGTPVPNPRLRARKISL